MLSDAPAPRLVAGKARPEASPARRSLGMRTSEFLGMARGLLDDVPEATGFLWSWCGEMSDEGARTGEVFDYELGQESAQLVDHHRISGLAELWGGSER